MTPKLHWIQLSGGLRLRLASALVHI